jgi:hypothetical protein
MQVTAKCFGRYTQGPYLVKNILTLFKVKVKGSFQLKVTVNSYAVSHHVQTYNVKHTELNKHFLPNTLLPLKQKAIYAEQLRKHRANTWY